MANGEILCSRCGTPFPQDRSKTAVTCVVCGQLRPDLDMTLDEDDDDVAGALGTGAAGASLRPMAAAAASPQSSTHLLAQHETGSREEFRVDRPYVSMGAEIHAGERLGRERTDSLADRLGPVLLVAVPLAAGMAGALNMLSLVPDFSVGSWYAVGLLFLVLLVGTLMAGLVASGFVHMLRVRRTIVLRTIYLLAAGAVAYVGIREFPNHVQVRENELPGVLLKR